MTKQFDSVAVYRGAKQILREMASIPDMTPEFRQVCRQFAGRVQSILEGTGVQEVLVITDGAQHKKLVPVLQVGNGDEDFFAALGAGDRERAVQSLRRMPVKGVC